MSGEDRELKARDRLVVDIEAANRALESANFYRGAARDLAEGARAPLESWQALRDAVRGTDEDGADALTEATGAAERLETALNETGRPFEIRAKQLYHDREEVTLFATRAPLRSQAP